MAGLRLIKRTLDEITRANESLRQQHRQYLEDWIADHQPRLFSEELIQHDIAEKPSLQLK